MEHTLDAVAYTTRTDGVEAVLQCTASGSRVTVSCGRKPADCLP
jgi:hypothetical protein